MASTIQVLVEDDIKESVDALFASLGFDTDTAVRMFLLAALQMGGIPFTLLQKSDPYTAIMESLERYRSGVHFLTAEESLAQMRAAIKAGVEYNCK